MNDSHCGSDARAVREKTYRLDLMRGAFRGIMAAGTQTFALFIAIRFYGAEDSAKSLIGAAPFIGMFLAPLIVHYLADSGWKKSFCGGLPAVFLGIFILAAAWGETLITYTLWVTLGFICLHLTTPFLTSIYHDNYPEGQRGTYYSIPVVLTVVFGVGSGYLGSLMMDADPQYHRWVLTALGLAGLGRAWAIFSMPAGPVEDSRFSNPFGNFVYMFENRSFGYVLLTWFIMGFANLWVLPLRVDYITSPQYGLEGSALMVATLITIIPDTMRALSIPYLARLFDSMNFIALRMILNTLFGLGIALFFLTKDPVIIGIGSALIGAAFGGGTIAWSLWVTKYAPKDKVSAYMSVHVCLTGIRGAIGPMIGFWAVHRVGPAAMGFISLGLMLLATLMLIPELKHGRLTRRP
ncbi:MAG: MFS transporter [Nitrospinaceae bacterium]